MAEPVENPGKALKEKSLAEFAKRTKGKPTPTQDELDRANLGEHIAEHEADGSDVEESPEVAAKHSEAKPGSGGSYQTRQATPARPKTE
jgi:hypothetical protein